MIADFGMILRDTSLALRNDKFRVVQFAQTLLLGVVVLGAAVAVLGPLHDRVADSLALIGDFIWFDVGEGDVAQESEAGEGEEVETHGVLF